MTLSTPIKVVALAALALALGLGGLLLLTAKHTAAPASIPVPAPVHHTVAHTAAPKPKPAPKRIVLEPGLPPVLRVALERHAAVVVAVYSSRVPADRGVVTEARAGARIGHAGFLAANVAVNAIAVGVARWSQSVRDPAVLVVRRPGRIVFDVSGTTDRHTVAQAALTSK